MGKQYGTNDEEATGITGQSLLKDSKGAWRTLSLFYETNTTAMDSVFTLRPHEWKGYPSAKEMYLSIADPTEYEFALALLGSWEHWQRVMRCKWFQEHLDDWRETLEVKLRSQAIQRVAAISKGGSPGALNASRWLAERGWVESKRGRPSKAEVTSERRRQALLDQEISDDLERISHTTH